MSQTARTSTSSPGDLRQALIRNLVLLAFLTGGAILLATIVGAKRTVRGLSSALIERTADRTEAELARFFDPVQRVLEVTREWGERGIFDLDEPDRLNELLVPGLVSLPQISSVIVADEDGREYMLLREQGGWSNRLTQPEKHPGEAIRRRFLEPGGAVDETRVELEYDARSRPWFQSALDAGPERVVWTEPYELFTTRKPGLTGSSTWRLGETGKRYVIAVDVLLADLSGYAANIDVSENGRVVVLSADGMVIGLDDDPETAVDDSDKAPLKKAETLGLPPLTSGLDCWREADHPADVAFAYTCHSTRWWGGFRPFDLGDRQQIWIGAVVPESDLLSEVRHHRDRIIGVTVAAILAAIVMAWWLDKKVKRRIEREVSQVRQLGQYTLERKIGDGAMGSVWRAGHAMLRRPCAVKLMHPDRASSQRALDRFEREVQLTSALTHPNTIAVYDYGRTPEGVFYYAMEYLPGITLEELVRRTGPVPPARVAHFLIQACGSLAEAHAAGLIHRDIKPANLMLCERGGIKDTIKVLDFGLVKDSDASASVSNPDGLTGTPLYTSPESIESPGDVGPRSDLYSLASVGYYLLTGAPVFDAPTLVSLCTKIAREAPAPLSERLEVPPPPDLEEAVMECLMKHPQDRPRDAQALARRLAECAAGWTQADIDAWWREHAGLFPRPDEPVDEDESVVLRVKRT